MPQGICTQARKFELLLQPTHAIVDGILGPRATLSVSEDRSFRVLANKSFYDLLRRCWQVDYARTFLSLRFVSVQNQAAVAGVVVSSLNDSRFLWSCSAQYRETEVVLELLVRYRSKNLLPLFFRQEELPNLATRFSQSAQRIGGDDLRKKS